MIQKNNLPATPDDDYVARRIQEIGDIPVSAAAAARAVGRAGELIVGARDRSARILQQPQPFPLKLASFIKQNRISMVATAAVLLIFAVSISSILSPNRAIAQTAKAIRAAKSYVLQEVQSVGNQSNDRNAKSRRRKVYWRAGGGRRIERLDNEGNSIRTTILSPNRSGIEINHEHRVYFEKLRDKGPLSDAFALEKLGQFDLQADRDLGTREFGGQVARGYEIDVNKIDPDFAKGELRLQVWIDPQTSLPIEVEYHMVGQSGRPPITIRMHDIRWNDQLSDDLFRTDPPQGYSKRVRSNPSEAEQVAMICEAFQIYADLLDGHYPRIAKIYPDRVCQEIRKRYGFDPFGPKTDEVTRSKEYVLINKASMGFGWLFSHFKSNVDIKYYGRQVGPEDTDKILVRWKLDDERYQVIFGDLRSKIMSKDSLESIESKIDKTSQLELPQSMLLTQPQRPFNRHPRQFGYTFDYAPTCHWQIQSYETSAANSLEVTDARDSTIAAIEEGWFVPNVGLRVEVRDNKDKLTKIIVQNNRWRYVWDPQEETVTASHPGSDLPVLLSSLIQIQTRRAVIEAKQRLHATFETETDEVAGEKTEKIEFRFLAEAAEENVSPIHSVPEDFQTQVESPGAQFRTRTYWFDPHTHLVRGRRCGCKFPKYTYQVDYPAHIPLEQFTFLIPSDAILVVVDEDLGRVLVSQSES